MQFYLMGSLDDTIAAALVRHGHKAHRAGEAVAGGNEPAAPVDDSPAEVIAFLQARQWNLVTTDSAWLRRLYEEKVEFPAGMIIHLLESAAGEDGAAIDRLFERYKRLTTKRLYTITGSRVKIRQLPGLPG